ncbi:MAG TPA: DUF72 domain-containing protein [Gammaproteobacteria bacterium]
MGQIFIGISGWRYQPWRGVFYPPGLKQERELEFASRALPTIELNGSFYSLQRPESYAAWYAATPPGFIFSIKGNQYITHILRLRDIDRPLANVFASGVFNLREKLGPFLWQFPPSFRYDPERVEHFLSLLPHDSEQALKLARKREARMKGRSRLAIDQNRKMRHAMEIRNASFVDESFIALLRKYKVALVVADTAGKWPYCEDVTADFMYLRLHGEEELYASGYTEAALERWAARIRAWSAGSEPEDAQHISTAAPARTRVSRDIYCYFDNDIKVKAPFDAKHLIEKLGLGADLVPFTWQEVSAKSKRPRPSVVIHENKKPRGAGLLR